jgi:CRP/FNR family transcriptional regulator, cyclic AMP receptor protein
MGLMMRRDPTLIPDVGELALFAHCSRIERARIRSLLTAILVPAGEVLIEQGAPPREFAVIADGEVAVTDADGVELAVLGPGAIVGELGLLRDMPTGATVTTLTPVVVYVGNRREFLAMLEASPDVDRRVLHVAIDRLRAS